MTGVSPGASRPAGGCSDQDDETWSALDGHKHRGGAAAKHYAGLDESLQETAIYIVDEAGGIVKERRAPSEPEAFAQALGAAGVPPERVGLEACSPAAWRHEGPREAGWSAVCTESRTAKAAMKTMPNSEAEKKTIR